MVHIRCSGPTALFANPHFRADPLSYPVPTPSALKGLVKSIYWKPEFEWEIRRFVVLNPIQFDTSVSTSIKMPGKDGRTQTTCTVLVDVAYMVSAEAVVNPLRSRDTADRYEHEFVRRLNAGQNFHTPTFGRKEYLAFVEHVSVQEALRVQGTPDSRKLGRMLLDLVPLSPGADTYRSVFYGPEMKEGVVYVPESAYARDRNERFAFRNIAHPHRSGEQEESL